MVHSFYSSRQPSGENQVVEAELAALRHAGCDVALFDARTDHTTTQRLYPLRAAARVASGYGHSPAASLRAWQPDVVHVHNLFPNFARRWVEHLDHPLVHTLHNYRPLCANGLLYRDGAICTLCPDGNRWSGLRHACYRDSRAATLPLTLAGLGGPRTDPLLRRADRLVVLSELQRSVYLRAGVAAQRLVTAPNFLPDRLVPDPELDTQADAPYLVVGRLSPEKGVAELVRRWPRELPLVVIGDGPERAVIDGLAHPAVTTVGALTRTQVVARLRGARALVFPSRWFETFGLSAIEALACGTPVLAARGTTVAAMVEQHGGGAVSGWDEWPDRLAAFSTDRAARTAARHAFESHYTEAAFVAGRTALYAALVTAGPP